jgi:transcriptional regulator with XRE-family HTH domain
MTPAQLIRDTRERKSLSQRRLALRAGTSQSAIARIERGEEEVTWSRLGSIMLAMGEEPQLSGAPVPGRYDPDALLQDRALPAGARLESGLRFNKFAGDLALAGRRAKAERDRA